MNREADGDELSMAAIVAVRVRDGQGNPLGIVNGTTSVGGYSGPAHTGGPQRTCIVVCSAGFQSRFDAGS